MRITWLLTQDIHSPSGVRFFALAAGLVRLGHQVTILALHPDFSSLTSKAFDQAGVHIRYVAQMHVRKQGGQKTYFRPWELAWVLLWATLALTWAALHCSADVFYIGKPHPMNSIAGCVAHLWFRCSLWLDCDDYEQGSGHFQSKLQQQMVAFFETHVPHWATAVTTNTFFMQSKLMEWGIPRENILVLPNGVEETRFPAHLPEQEIEDCRRGLGVADSPTLAFIGSLSLVNHPVNLLLEAFAKVIQDIPEAVLLLVGSGEDAAVIEAKVENLKLTERVRMVGRVPPDVVARYYHAAQLIVDPVYDDDAARGRCPLKLFESWQCGVPFVTGKVGDRAILAGNPSAAWLVEPGSVEALTQGILRVMADPILAGQLAAQGRERVRSFYWASLAQALDQFLRRVV